MTPTPDATDAEVVQSTFDNKEAFALLVHRYEEKLRRYIRRIGVRNEEDQNDVLQDIFIKAYKNLHAFDQSLSFSSWIYRIAHNEAISHYRKRSVRPEGMQYDDGDTIIANLHGEDDLMDDIVTRDDGRVLREALGKLDEKYREIVVLRYFEGKEYEEISDILEMPLGSVATRLHRAKARLKEVLTTTP
jgi:RNA polymerase sigma-70 factor (ECF subfamily)